MKEKIAKIGLWMGTIIIVVLAGIAVVNKIFAAIIPCTILIVSLCPLTDEIISKRYNKKDTGYYQKARCIILFLAVIFLVLFMSFLVSILKESTVELIEMIMKMLMYIVYLAISFMYRDASKCQKYIVFGIFYIIYNLISFIPENFDVVIVNALNWMFRYQHLNIISYRLIIDGVIMPIKESALTYIIFDTVFDNIDNKKKMEKQEETYNVIHKNSDEFQVLVEEQKTNMSKEYLIKVGRLK